jgi:plasmid stability protein
LVLKWLHSALTRFEGELIVPVNLSIKNVPDHLAERLRLRATASHRSMQGELMVILEQALEQTGPLSPDAVLAKVRELELSTAREATNDIRRERDGR